ncbi:MAG: hypothetical protein Q7R41_17000, partial [Phycisphaerales bacterium]|nr:hypothetical protein [Phycisphaerales bacterium]
LIVPIGETRQVTVGGALQGPTTTADARPDISATSLNPDGRTLSVKGLSPGNGAVMVCRDGFTIAFDVSVRKYAGRATSAAPVYVTGCPTPAALCVRLAESEASRCLELEPGARASVLSPTTKMDDLPRGGQVNLTFPIQIEGAGYIPVAASATVRVINEQLSERPVGNLMYSNSPERVTKYGLLFAGSLNVDNPTRLLYHHQNVIGKPFLFNVILLNLGSTLARVQVVKGAPEPQVDTVAVGYRAGVEFMRSFGADVGEIVEMPPMSKLAIYSRIVDRTETASGITQFRQLEGSPLLVRVAADIPDGGILPERAALEAFPADGITVGFLHQEPHLDPTKDV